MYLAMVAPVNATKRMMLRKKMIRVATLITGLPFPYGNAWTKEDVAPVPMITVCQAQVKCLSHFVQEAITYSRLMVLCTYRMHSFHDVRGDAIYENKASCVCEVLTIPHRIPVLYIFTA